MAPKRRQEDDFVYTLSDNEELPTEELPVELEEEEALPPRKKAKTTRKAKKNKKDAPAGNDEDEEKPQGVWGQNDEDDGAMDPDFVFMMDGAGTFAEEDFDGWGFEGARKNMGPERRGVDLDEIIRRRREKKNGKAPEVNDEGSEADHDDEVEVEVENDMEVDLDDDDDEVLADDAFGMNAASENEEEDEGSDDQGDRSEGEDEDDGDKPASDDDSVATPVNHPDDEDSDASDEEDAEEEAKRKAFFAPEEKEKPGKKMDASTFLAMSLSRPIMRGLTNVGFSKPTPIQHKAIPIALMGKDIVGGAVTGSGKTGAFMIPILDRLVYRPNKVPTTRVVVLTPTRELAMQCHAVSTKIAAFTDIKFTLAVGGLSLKAQEAELRLRPDVIIATPGRFIDHMRNSASFNVDTVEILVLDEADRMLEDGFADELNEILTTLPKSRQTMLFSATMTSSVDRLVRLGMDKPVRIMVDSQKKTVGTLVQEFVRLRPGREDKRLGYLVHLCKTLYTERVIVFFRQKKEAHRARIIFGLLGISCGELHGSMNQTMRIENVEAFRDGKVTHLLATDLASRGLDIKGVDTVINYEAPQSLEIYVHRVGRTARAGRRGTAVTLAAEPDRKVVKAAVKAGKAQGAKVVSRTIDPADADKWQDQIDAMDGEIDAIIKEEKQEKQLAQAEMQLRKGENMIEHEEQIKSRPKRTWFETQDDKKKSKKAGADELNGMREGLKRKTAAGTLSNKDKKRLDAKALRKEGKLWKGGKKEKDTYATSGRSKRGPGRSKAKAKAKGGKQSLLRYLFPRAVRDRYREGLLDFHLDTLPQLKHRLQSRIYRFILGRQRRRAEGSRIIDHVARHSRRLLLGPQYPPRVPRARQPAKDGRQVSPGAKIRGIPTTGGPATGYGASGMSSDGDVNPGGRGYRRARLAAMAGNLYRSGQQAVSGMRDQYAQTRVGLDAGNDGHGRTHIPGAFPDVAIHVQGNDQMVIFPSYAKRHVKKDWSQVEQQQQQQQQNPQGNTQGTVRDEDYWRQEWEKNEDEKAIVDVDVRGWVYSPQLGPMTRRNRMLIGLARQLSGITAPRNEAQQPQDSPGGALRAQHQMDEERREQERIQREAANIERRGQEEKRAAYHGDYSERPQRNESENGSIYPYRAQQGSESDSGPSSPIQAATQYSTTSTPSAATEMSEAELAVANANLMARIAPFMTNPLVALPITVFFYNESQSQSRTVITNDAGHFVLRAALDFVPTHVRVLANEKLSAIQEVYITEPHGVSLISDVDDTIKKSNISGGAKEIFRNTFVHSLGDLTIDGVKEWYNDMYQLGVSIHYCSNSPWQLYPVLASYFKLVGLPPGSLHLKQYTGMLQGIFEPVAERKKSTLERLLRDFPERKFMLVGDSGEADLEVYTELAIANPGRILAIFIRDVTTPEKTEFFETSFGGVRRQASSLTLNESKPQPPRPLRQRPSAPALREEKKSSGPVMEDLINLSEEPQQVKLQESAASNLVRNTKKPPPPRPAKPASLRSTPSIVEPSGTASESSPQDEKAPPLPARRTATHPLAQMQSSSQQTSGSSRSGTPRNGVAPQDISRKPLADRTVPPPPPPRRRGTPASMRSTANSDVEYDPLPPPSASAGSLLSAGTTRSAGRSPGVSPPASPQLGPQQTKQALNRKLDLWNRRLERAHEELDALGVALYTWRRGQDVIEEAVGIVTRAHREMERKGQKARDR